MNGEFARTQNEALAIADRTSAVEPVSEWMRWNDVSLTPSRLRPALLTAPIDEPQAPSGDG